MKRGCANLESDVGSSGSMKPDCGFDVSGTDVLPSKVIEGDSMEVVPPPENRTDMEIPKREHIKEGCEEKTLICDVSNIFNSNSPTKGSHHEMQHERNVDSGIPSLITEVIQSPNGPYSEPPLKASEIHKEAVDIHETNQLPDRKADGVLAEEAIHFAKTDSDGKVETSYGELSTQKQQNTNIGCLVNEMSGSHYRQLLSNPSGCSPMSNSTTSFKTIKKCLVSNKPGRSKSLSLLPDIGLHLNAVASAGGDKLLIGTKSSVTCESNLLSSPCTSPSSNPSDGLERDCEVRKDYAPQTGNICEKSTFGECGISQSSLENKRIKTDSVGETDSCKHCNCKKSKCLKLYCECFAAGIYCVQNCNCQDCFNKPSHVDTVIATRRLIESRNPLAFAPKVIVCSDTPSNANTINMTPVSARSKRGCHCKKSGCVKKYCECFQVGVGCSLSCRCESCKNTFGRKEGTEGTTVYEAKILKECASDLSSRDKFSKLDDANQSTPEHSNNKSFTSIA